MFFVHETSHTGHWEVIHNFNSHKVVSGNYTVYETE